MKGTGKTSIPRWRISSTLLAYISACACSSLQVPDVEATTEEQLGMGSIQILHRTRLLQWRKYLSEISGRGRACMVLKKGCGHRE
jgi:hypothetical protein